MPEIKEAADERYLPIKKMGKLYLYLIILGRLVFLMERVSLPENLPLNSNLIETIKFMSLSVIGNELVKSICFLSLVLYSMFVLIESFMVLRSWGLSFYAKVTNNKMLEKK